MFLFKLGLSAKEFLQCARTQEQNVWTLKDSLNTASHLLNDSTPEACERRKSLELNGRHFFSALEQLVSNLKKHALNHKQLTSTLKTLSEEMIKAHAIAIKLRPQKGWPEEGDVGFFNFLKYVIEATAKLGKRLQDVVSVYYTAITCINIYSLAILHMHISLFWLKVA